MAEDEKTYTIRCRLCERDFEVVGYRRRALTRLCPYCAEVVAKVRHRVRDARRARGGAKTAPCHRGPYDQVSDDALMSARKKPRGCSDVRWRIELRRRRNAAFYGLFGDKP